MADIVFADDEPHIRRLVAKVLDRSGHRVREAPDGASALAEIRRALPDMAVLDYRMGTPDGFEVCRMIKTDPRLSHLPVLILTGEGRIENRLDGFSAGADDYLAKPFDPRELAARVEALLRLSRSGLDRNPTSGLPGGEALEREFARWAERHEVIAVCYLDLDDFKPFSEHFGFSVADAVIRDLGEVLSVVAAEASGEAFAGHVGGDDFILLVEPERARSVVRRAQEDFLRAVRKRIPEEDRQRGSYRAEDREGVVREFPLTRLSAAIVRVPAARMNLLDRLGERISAAKQAAKQKKGSTEGGLLELDLADLPARRAEL